jgi:hypothetical protein
VLESESAVLITSQAASDMTDCHLSKLPYCNEGSVVASIFGATGMPFTELKTFLLLMALRLALSL